MFNAVVQHTPVWVWILLVKLVALGLYQARDRDLSLARVTVLPLVLIALSLGGVLSSFGHAPLPLGGWAAGVGAALAFARHAVAVRGAAWSPSTRRLHVPGSFLPLALIVGLFAIKYAAGVSLALQPSLASNATFVGLCSLAYGGFSGLFLARALSLRSLATQGQALQTA